MEIQKWLHRGKALRVACFRSRNWSDEGKERADRTV